MEFRFLLLLMLHLLAAHSARAQITHTIPGVAIAYDDYISLSKARCEAILTGCSGGFSSTSCIKSWCPSQPPTTGFNPANTTTTWACDQVCCPFVTTTSGKVDYSAASGCLLNQGLWSTTAIPSASLGRTPGAVLGSDPNFSACMTLSVNTEVCNDLQTVTSAGTAVGVYCTCWNGPNKYWGRTFNQLATSCASFYGSFYGKSTTVTSYLSLGAGLICNNIEPTFLFTEPTIPNIIDPTSSSSSSSTSVPLWPGFVTAPPAPPHHQHPLATTASPASASSLVAPTSSTSSDSSGKSTISWMPTLVVLMVIVFAA